MGQWIAREFIAHRGGAKFSKDQTSPARCPLLGYSLKPIMVEGRMIGPWFLEVDKQPEVGETAYDAGAEILEEFFHRELRGFLDTDLHPLGSKIIDCCLNGGTLADYEAFIDTETISEE